LRGQKVRALTAAQQSRLAGAPPPPQRAELFSTAWLADRERAACLAACTAIVGLHPDQATDAIVDVALALRKPFALLPCCVYAQQHPHRRRPSDGEPVRSHADLLSYLAAKDTAIQQATLGFYGRNVVLFWLPLDL
jgi:hypothetical protein